MAVTLGSRAPFYFEDGVTFLNHGSFGKVPRPVYEARLKRMMEMECNLDEWFSPNCFYPLLKKGLQCISQLIKCPADEVVFVENATTGVTTALRSLNLTPKDGLLVSNLTYESVQHTADRLCNKDTLATLHVIQLDPPYTDKREVVERYRSYLSSHPEVRVAIVDHITSPSTLVLPVKDIVSVCHEFGVLVIIDGAHAPGQLDINVTDIGAEYYTGNLHKWCFTPRGCAFLHIRSDQRTVARPLLASNWYHKPYPQEFFQQGTRDNTSMTVVPEAMEFFESLGGLEAIQSYCSSLLEWAVNMISDKTGEPLLPVPRDMIPPYMSAVRFPSDLQGDKTKAYGKHIQSVLRYEYKINTAIDFIAGELWCRLSCSVYNVREDYERYVEALLDLKTHPEKLTIQD